MKTLLIFIFISINLLNADYLNTKSNNICIYQLEALNKGFCYVSRHDNIKYCDKKLTIDELIDGYSYINNQCVINKDLQITGLTENQLNYQFAIMGNLIGFSFLFLILFISSLAVRK